MLWAVTDERQPESRRSRLIEVAAARGVPLATILTTVLVVVVVYLAGRLVYKLREILLLMVVAGFIALLLNPAVVGLRRIGVKRRGSAVAIVTVLAVAAFVGAGLRLRLPARERAHSPRPQPAQVRAPGRAREGLARPPGPQVPRGALGADNLAPKLATFAKNLSKPALAVGKGAVSLIIALLTIFVLVLLLLLEGHKLRSGVLRMMSPARAERTSRIAGEVSRSVTGYMIGNFITSLVAGIVVFVTLTVLGVPFALLWGLWVALLDFLPMIGGAVAGIPTVLFAFAHSVTLGHRGADRVPRLHPDREPRPEPDRHEPDGPDQPAAGADRDPGRGERRRPRRRVLRRLRRDPAGDPAGRLHPGHRAGGLAGHRARAGAGPGGQADQPAASPVP